MISIVSGLIAVVIFIMVISAYAGSGGSTVAGAPIARETPGQPVDSEAVYGGGGGTQQTAATAPTAQPVNGEQAQQSQQAQSQPVVAPSANAPANPFTSGIH